MKLSLSILWPGHRCSISAQGCSHGAVSPCRGQRRHESASPRGADYNVYETRSSLIIAWLCSAIAIEVLPANAQVNVTQEHNHLSRDGLYIDSAFTPANAANLMRDLGFDGTNLRQCVCAAALH
jgi:hypothetical protein